MLDTLKTILTTFTGAQTAATDDGDDRESTTLYRCPDCEAVYVAVEKDECSDCATPVERAEGSSGDP